MGDFKMQTLEKWLSTTQQILKGQTKKLATVENKVVFKVIDQSTSEDISVAFVLDRGNNVKAYEILIGESDCVEEYSGETFTEFKEDLQEIHSELLI